MSPSLPEDRLASIEARLEKLEHVADRIAGLEAAARAAVAMGTDSVDRLAADAPHAIERLRALLSAAEKLSRPEMVARLEAALDAAEKLPAGLAMATDTLDRLASSLADRGVDLTERFVILARLLERLTSPEILRVLEQGLQHHEAASRILSSGAFDPAALDIIGKLAGALSGAAEAPPRIGLWGAMKAAGTEPVQHALGFAVALASRFGESISGRGTKALVRGAR